MPLALFFYVCQSGSWHTSLLKSDKFRDFSNPGLYIFLSFYEHIPWMFVHLFQIIPNFKFKYLCTSWIKLITSYHYCLSCGPPSETSGLVMLGGRESEEKKGYEQKVL